MDGWTNLENLSLCAYDPVCIDLRMYVCLYMWYDQFSRGQLGDYVAESLPARVNIMTAVFLCNIFEFEFSRRHPTREKQNKSVCTHTHTPHASGEKPDDHM